MGEMEIGGAAPRLTTTGPSSRGSGASVPRAAPGKLSGQTSLALQQWKYFKLLFLDSSPDDPRYNLASSLYGPQWEEGLYRLISDGHCHTFNPENVSYSGLQGQHYLNLGHQIISVFTKLWQAYMLSCSTQTAGIGDREHWLTQCVLMLIAHLFPDSRHWDLCPHMLRFTRAYSALGRSTYSAIGRSTYSAIGRSTYSPIGRST